MSVSSEQSETITLPDGRLLDVRISGPAGGTPLVFHHGTPGAKTPTRAIDRAVHEHGLRAVGSSRPGYGGSSRQEGRAIVDVVEDTRAILRHLGASRCFVAGWSGGGPHALACAARLDEAAASLVIAGLAPYEAEGLDWLGGMGEDNLAEFGAAVAGEAELRPFLETIGPVVGGADLATILSSIDSLLPPVDTAQLTDEFGEDLVASFHEAVRTGIEGWLDDDLAFVKPWGFELTEISSPVAIWQGSDDLMVPSSHGRWLGAHVPGAQVHLEEGEGHLSIGLGAIDAMLDELTAAG